MKRMISLLVCCGCFINYGADTPPIYTPGYGETAYFDLFAYPPLSSVQEKSDFSGSKALHDFVIYPVQEGLKIESKIKEMPQGLTVRIYDLNGRLIRRSSLGAGRKEAFISLENSFERGVYLMEIRLGSEIRYTQKAVWNP